MIDLTKDDWVDDIKTIEDLAELLEHGHEFDVKYKDVYYHVENEYSGYGVVGENEECYFDTPEEFMEKATIGGDLLKDVMDKIEFTLGA
ncbi:MAG: hypothetical protein Q4C95_11440 [Planctomycetia bacterium]|nr:hypothetical protein [Planctomycetia bacterium]